MFLPFFFFFNFCLIISGMTTRFSKQKLAEAQEKKAKGGIVNGLLSKKKVGDDVKKDPVITPSPIHWLAKHPCFSHFVIGDDCLWWRGD